MWLLCCLPPIGTESASCSIGFSKLNSPAHQYLCLRFKRYLAISPARLEARMDSLLSFPVGLFHPLQHAGLSRRSPVCRQSGNHSAKLANGSESWRFGSHCEPSAPLRLQTADRGLRAETCATHQECPTQRAGLGYEDPLASARV